MNILKMLGANAAAAASGVSLAFRASATSTASTITVPSGVVAGDLIVMYDRGANSSGFPTSVIPTGFTEVINQTHDSIRRTVCSFKIADGTEAGTNITGLNATTSNTKLMFVFSTNGATVGLAYDVAFQSTDADPTAQVVNASGGSSPLVVLSFMRQVTATGQSFSPTQDGTVSASENTGYYKIYNSSPADVTVDCGDGGNFNALMSFYITVSNPAPASYSYNEIRGSASDLSTYTFSAVSIGTAATNRLVVVVIAWTGVSATVSSVTFGGVSATVHTTAFGSDSARMAIASLVVSSGTTSSILVGFSGTPLRCTIASYSLYDLASTTPVDTLAVGVSTAGSTISGAINVASGGVVIGGSYINSSTVTTSWTNLVENAERVEETARTTSVASEIKSVGSTLTTTATFSSSLADNKALVVASWR